MVIKNHQKTRSTAWAIVIAIAAKHDVPVSDLLSIRRNWSSVLARHECWFRLRNEVGMKYAEIAQMFERDHTTIRSGVRRHAQRADAHCRTPPRFSEKMEQRA